MSKSENMIKAESEFNRDYANFRKIDHDFIFHNLPRLESEGQIFMKKAFAAYAAGKENMGNIWAELAERFFIKAQLLKTFKVEKSVLKRNINSKIKPFLT